MVAAGKRDSTEQNSAGAIPGRAETSAGGFVWQQEDSHLSGDARKPSAAI